MRGSYEPFKEPIPQGFQYYSKLEWRERIDGARIYRFPQAPAADSPIDYFCEYAYSLAAIFFSLFVAGKPNENYGPRVLIAKWVAR